MSGKNNKIVPIPETTQGISTSAESKEERSKKKKKKKDKNCYSTFNIDNYNNTNDDDNNIINNDKSNFSANKYTQHNNTKIALEITIKPKMCHQIKMHLFFGKL